ADYRSHADGPGQAAHGPDLLAGGQVVAGDAERARDHELFPTRHVPDHRRTVAAQEFGAIRPPDRLARPPVHGQQERALVVVLTEDHRAIDEDGRAAGAEVVLEGPHRLAPEQPAVAVVTEDAPRAEEADDALGVGGRAGLGVAADLVDLLERRVG